MIQLFKSILWWIWPTTEQMQARKQQVPKNANPPPPPTNNNYELHQAYWIAYNQAKLDQLCQVLNTIAITQVYGNITTLDQQLKHAIDIEDYEEAARIRDIIAKQNASQPPHGDNKTK